MKKNLLLAAMSLAGMFTLLHPALAQTAGSTTVAVAAFDMTEVARGWSAKKGILGKTVFNEAGAKVGKVEDLIITPDKFVSYLIIGAGGFVGIGRHDVAVPMAQITTLDGRITMPGATKDVIKAMPKFDYAADTSTRDKFIANAESDMAKARTAVAGFEKKASAASGEAKVKMDKEIASLKQDLKAAEDKLSEMKSASVAKWKEFEADVGKTMTRLRASVHKATA